MQRLESGMHHSVKLPCIWVSLPEKFGWLKFIVAPVITDVVAFIEAEL
jgi:hypothetical protein